MARRHRAIVRYDVRRGAVMVEGKAYRKGDRAAYDSSATVYGEGSARFGTVLEITGDRVNGYVRVSIPKAHKCMLECKTMHVAMFAVTQVNASRKGRR